jgi:hypothetical protein
MDADRFISFREFVVGSRSIACRTVKDLEYSRKASLILFRPARQPFVMLKVRKFLSHGDIDELVQRNALSP